MKAKTTLFSLTNWRRAASTITLIVLSSAISAPHALAGTFSVTPVRIFMQPKDRATAITLTNDGSTEVVLQADLNDWTQTALGEDQLTLTEELVVSPPIIKLAPGARQVVRLARLNMSAASGQQTYRLIVREIPEIAAARQGGVTLQIALALSMPVFVTPAGAKADMVCTQAKADAKAVSVSCKNAGNSHAQIRSATLKRGGVELARLENGGYYLAGSRRDLVIPTIDFSAGPVELLLALDDGNSPSFTLQVQP
jgi:fimbrial chaperone protein